MPILIVVFAAGAYGLRGGPARQRRHRQRDRHRARRPGRDRGHRAGLPRRLLADRAASTRSASRAARSCRRRSTATCSAAIGTATVLDVLQGDPARVRDLAVGFGSLRTIRAETPVAVPLDRGRPPSRGRPPQGHGQERLQPAARATRRSSSARPSPSSTISSRAPRPGRRRRAVRTVRRRACRTRSSARCLRKRRDHDTGARPDVCSPLHGRPADATTRYGHRPTCSRPTARSSSPGARTTCSRSRSRARSRGSSATSCTTCRRGWRSAARPRSGPTCCGRPSSSPTRSSSTARTRRRSTSAAARSRSPIGRSASRAGSTATELTIGLNFGEQGLSVVDPEPDRAARRRSRRPASPPTTRSVQAGCSSTASPRSSCSTSSRAPGSGCPTSQSGTQYAVDSPARYVDPASGTVLSGSSTTRPTASGSRSTCRSAGTSNERDRPHRGPGQALRPDGRGGRHRPRHRPGRDLRAGRAQRRRQDDDAADAGDAPAADGRDGRDRRLVGHPEPRRGPARPRLHAGRVRGLRRHEGLGVPRLLRPLLRAAGGAAGAG